MVAGFVVTNLVSDHRDDTEATTRDAADCRSLNDRTRFGTLTRERDVRALEDRVANLQDRLDDPFDPTAFPGYNALDESTQVFVQGLLAQSREETLTDLAEARIDVASAKADLELYTEQIPLLDCPGTAEGIDDADFTGR